MTDVVSRYDSRAGVEADLKSDKHGLALAVIRKRRLAAQRLVVLLIPLAHNVLFWARQWLVVRAARLRACGIVRLVREVWAIPGRVKQVGEQIRSVRLRRAHPRARDVCCGFRPLLASSQTLGFWR
jgi:hypothetical protein